MAASVMASPIISGRQPRTPALRVPFKSPKIRYAVLTIRKQLISITQQHFSALR